MTILIIGELLDGTNPLLVKKLHIVTGITIEEVVSSHAQPEQMYLAVGVGTIVIDPGDIGRCERTVGAEVRELIQIVESA